jgi:micrococcal nuclease
MDQFIGFVMDAARWLIILILTLIYPEDFSSWSGKVVEVVRPEQIRVMRNGTVEDVRLYGIDTPLELQEFGRTAQKYLSDRVDGKIVRVQPLPAGIKGPWNKPDIARHDYYNRIIGLVWVDGESLNKELVRKGMAWWYKPFVPFERGYKHLQDQAREEKLGLWAFPRVVPPWEFQDTDIETIHPLVDQAHKKKK